MTLTPRDARKLDAITEALASSDPRLARSLARRRPPGLTVSRLALAVAVLAGAAVSYTPLVVGLLWGVLWLVAAGMLFATLVPVFGPLLVVRRVRTRQRRGLQDMARRLQDMAGADERPR